MGTWGPKLYQDDIAQEVKDYYTDQLHRGKKGAQITQELIKNYECALSDENDASVFWFALADTQWNFGRLEDFVKNQALYHIHLGNDVKRWEKEDFKQAQIRQKVLVDLEKRILSPQPPEKRVSLYKLYRCSWKIGDVFAYQFKSEYAKENGLYNRYLLILKIDEGEWWPGHIVPIVYFKITNDDILPKTQQEIDGLEYVQTFFTRWEDRFLPIDMNLSLEEQLSLRNGEKFRTDEFGFLPHFRMQIITTSAKMIPKQLCYIGNFCNLTPPKIEFVPHCKSSISSIYWKDLEKSVIDRYCGYNLRQASVYRSKK